MSVSDFACLVVPGAVGVAVGHLLVRYLLRRSVPELADMSRRARNVVYSDLERVDLPTADVTKRVVLTYVAIVAVFALCVFSGSPIWMIGLAYSFVLPLLIVVRYQMAKQYVVHHVRCKLSTPDRSAQSESGSRTSDAP